MTKVNIIDIINFVGAICFLVLFLPFWFMQISITIKLLITMGWLIFLWILACNGIITVKNNNESLDNKPPYNNFRDSGKL